MTMTDFAALQPHKKRAWGHSAYEAFRDAFFFRDWLGKGQGAVVENITELTKNNKGVSGAMLHLVADLEGGGATGDNQLEGRESKLDSYWQEVQFDQLRKAVRDVGRCSDQRSVINFRKEARNKLAFWLANSAEDMMVLTASGLSYALNTDGSPRVTPVGEDAWTQLDFAADVKVPTANRHFRWDVDTISGLQQGDTTQVAAADVPKYGMVIDSITEAQSRGLKPIRRGGREYYVFLVHPRTMGHLYKDSDFRSAIINAGVRGEDNKIFNGAMVTMHGAIIHPWRKVFTTLGATAPNKWGGGSVNGSRTLLLGSQGLALADLETPVWEEKPFDYGNSQGIAIAKMWGCLKPQFYCPIARSVEDFGVIAIDHAL